MATINKSVTGVSENLKAVKNAKNASKTPMGGTTRSTFEGSRDMRKTGEVAPNMVLKSAPGYVDQGDVMMGDVSHSRSFTSKRSSVSMNGNITTSKEDVTRGMGGRVIKEMK